MGKQVEEVKGVERVEELRGCCGDPIRLVDPFDRFDGVC
jgi:hypothetical protein